MGSHWPITPAFGPTQTEYQVTLPLFVDHFGLSLGVPSELELSIEGTDLGTGGVWESPGLEPGETRISWSVSAHDMLLESYSIDVSRTDAVEVYGKASNVNSGDNFARSVALSADGRTLAVGAPYQSDSSKGISEGRFTDNQSESSGAVYVFTLHPSSGWMQQAYIKASNAQPEDHFGTSVALSADGSTLVVGAPDQDDHQRGVANGSTASQAAPQSGAAYVFIRSAAGAWMQQAYVKASNADLDDKFGGSVALSGDGNTLAVGAPGEGSNTTGIGTGTSTNGLAESSGAVYILARDSIGAWEQQAYIKASNAEEYDAFSSSVSLSADGNTLAVGAPEEDGGADAIPIGPQDNRESESGAAYIFVRTAGAVWTQHSYLKALNTDAGSRFGGTVALSADGRRLALGSPYEASAETGISDGTQLTDYGFGSGAVYLFELADDDWRQRVHFKASNNYGRGFFGATLALSGNGKLLVATDPYEASPAVGIHLSSVPQDPWSGSGAAYYFVETSPGVWQEGAYLKASNAVVAMGFGWAVAMDDDGTRLAIGAPFEDGGNGGIPTSPADQSEVRAGAVYLFE